MHPSAYPVCSTGSWQPFPGQSFLGWSDMEALRGWKAHPEFKERMG